MHTSQSAATLFRRKALKCYPTFTGDRQINKKKQIAINDLVMNVVNFYFPAMFANYFVTKFALKY